DAAQAIRATRRLSRDGGGNAHLQHAVRDQAWQTDGPREIVVEVDRVAVARRLGIGGDLLPGEGHLAFAHERITNSARDRHSGALSASVVSVSKLTKRIPRRLVSEATRPVEMTVSPTRGCRCHSNSCSAWRSFAKSTAASSSPNSCGTVTPSEYTAANVGGIPSAGSAPMASAYAAMTKPRASAPTGSKASGNVLCKRRPVSSGVSPGRRSAPARLARARAHLHTAITVRGRRYLEAATSSNRKMATMTPTILVSAAASSEPTLNPPPAGAPPVSVRSPRLVVGVDPAPTPAIPAMGASQPSSRRH